MSKDTQYCIFAILLYVVLILYIYGMYRMNESNTVMLRGTRDEL